MRKPTEEEQQTMFVKALKARERAYCPYSNFHVGACLLTEDGSFITGGNVENAAYSPGICAERSAVGKAFAEGHKRFIGCAVASDNDGPCSPCGVCRQVLREFCPLDMPIYMVHASWSQGKSDKLDVRTLEQLLPMSFGPDDLVKA